MLNILTLYCGDDYVYRFVYQKPVPTDNSQIINTLLIPQSQINHYFNWNGRFVAHTIVQFFMQFNNKLIFDVFNSVAFIGLIVLMSLIVRTITGKKLNAFLLMVTFVYLWYFIPDFGQTVLWLSGSGNYLWTSLIYLGFILFCLKRDKSNKLSIVIAVILGFLAGATNENSGPTAILIATAILAFRLLKYKQLDYFVGAGIMSAVSGFMLMLRSPGSLHRAHVETNWDFLINNFISINKMMIQHFWLVYVLVTMLLIAGLLTKKMDRQSLVFIGIFTLGHLASIYSMALSPDFPKRTFFGGAVFLGIVLMILAFNVFDNVDMDYLILFGVGLGMIFLFSYHQVHSDLSTTHQEVHNQYQIIRQSKAKNKDVAKIPMISEPETSYNAYKGTAQIQKESYDWMNIWMAKHFGINQIEGY
ncbi:DUF3329 domain-containing protein [Companilactobacillus mishanensis]|uniref:Glycosyltransferase RgtA/B/C/D-like domain-containing protein n=1 Tax=Companilactobacillus mishanensis TaxID=2486008 RepID=A0A5P0ZJ15_9LACO|nr:hypothetical protein [Companilactobacillus mishanensis]